MVAESPRAETSTTRAIPCPPDVGTAEDVSESEVRIFSDGRPRLPGASRARVPARCRCRTPMRPARSLHGCGVPDAHILPPGFWGSTLVDPRFERCNAIASVEILDEGNVYAVNKHAAPNLCVQARDVLVMAAAGPLSPHVGETLHQELMRWQI